MTTILNLYGGPGTGKSTTAAGLFHELKLRGVSCELSREYAKDKVWEQSLAVLEDQVYILGKQWHRLSTLIDSVDIVVTDSPILLSLIYGDREGPEFAKFVMALYKRVPSFNVFLERVKPYSLAGRVQDETKARLIDGTIREMLKQHNIHTHLVTADERAPSRILTRMREEGVLP